MKPSKRKTVFNRKPLVFDKILKVPDVPRRCDSMDIEKGYVHVGVGKLYFKRKGAGDGMPIVLINGGPGGTHHDFHPCFSEAAKSAEIIYYDQRGCGLSFDPQNPRNDYTLEQAVEDLDKLRGHLDIDKWCVLGHSYGGVLARLWDQFGRLRQ